MNDLRKPTAEEEQAARNERRNRVGRIRLSVEMLSNLFFTPETEVLRVLPSNDIYCQDAIALDVRHKDLPDLEVGKKIPEMSLIYSVCRAGHIERISVSLLGEPSGYREIDIYDRRQMHEACPSPGPIEP